jgi:hypothetical protein
LGGSYACEPWCQSIEKRYARRAESLWLSKIVLVQTLFERAVVIQETKKSDKFEDNTHEIYNSCRYSMHQI